MTPHRVAHITTVDQSLHYLLLHQLQTIRACGYEVATISAPGDDVQTLISEGFVHFSVPMTRSINPVSDLRSIWRLYRLMRRERFTIVHTHTPKASLLGQLAARSARVPIIVNTVHGFYFHDGMNRKARRFYVWMERLSATCSHRILSQNQEDLDTAIRERISSAAKLRLLGNGIDLHDFNPDRFTAKDVLQKGNEIGLLSSCPVVGFVGRLAAKRKGFLDFLAAAKQVRQAIPGVQFLIVGEPDAGKPDAVSPATAIEYGIDDACHFLGHRPNNDLPLLYRLMDVIVLPSAFEGLPRVIMEGAAMGVPAVVSDVKGNREAVEHGGNGLRVPYGDVDAIANAILRILTDDVMARRMAEQAKIVAREQFDEQKVFARVLKEYEQLLRDRNLHVPSTGQPNVAASMVHEDMNDLR